MKHFRHRPQDILQIPDLYHLLEYRRAALPRYESEASKHPESALYLSEKCETQKRKK